MAALAARLAAGPTRSYAGTKRQLNNWLYSRMAEQLELEARIQREMSGSEDFLEGAMAFVREAPGALLGALENPRAKVIKRIRRRLNTIPAALAISLPTLLAFFTPQSGGSPTRKTDRQPLQGRARRSR